MKYPKYGTVLHNGKPKYTTQIEGPITPCGNRSEFDESDVTVENGKAYFWYNTEDHSTHCLVLLLENKRIREKNKKLRRT